MEKKKLTFLCYHNRGGGYMLDMLNFGKLDEMELWWDLSASRRQGRKGFGAEAIMLENYLEKKELKIDRSLANCRKLFDFIINDVTENGITIPWLKKNTDLAALMSCKSGIYRI